MNKKNLILLCVIIVIAIGARLYKLNIPLADFHSWRQADTMAVARNFSRDGINLLRPKFDDLSNIQSGIYNLNGYRMVEFPVYNALVATLSNMTNLQHHISGRLISILFSVATLAVIFYLLISEIGIIAAFWGGLFFALNPYNVFYSRTTLPDNTAIGFAFLSIGVLYYWYKNQKNCPCFLTSGVLFALAILVKPTSIFWGLPLFYLFLFKYRKNILKKWQFYIFWLISIVPLFWWRDYIKQFPEGTPASSWLFTSVNTGGMLMNIFFRPAFFRWVFIERITNLISGGANIAIIFIGFLQKTTTYILQVIIFSSLSYLFIFQGGNVQHDYYQILIFPTLAILFGAGASAIVNSSITKSKFLSYIVIFVIFCFGTYNSWSLMKSHYDTNGGLITAAKILSTITPNDALIATDTVGDTTLLYLANRKGFPAITDDSLGLKSKGISYITASTPSEKKKNDDDKNLKKIFDNEQIAVYQIL